MDNTRMKALYSLDALLENLYLIITKGNRSVTKYAEDTIRLMRSNIKTALSQNDDSITIFKILKSSYYSMFPPKSGLSEFYIWDNDYMLRCKLNSDYENIKSQIKRILDEY